MPGRLRDNIKIGGKVGIVLKKDQTSQTRRVSDGLGIVSKKNSLKTGIITKGVVMKLLTKVAKHHRGIKVMLEDKQVGRVQKIY